VVYVASSQRSHKNEVEDGRVGATGYIELFYPYFIVFVVLGLRGILAFFDGPINKNLWGWGYLHFTYLSFAFFRLGLLWHELIFVFNNQMREG
jgi:hypothetical protein